MLGHLVYNGHVLDSEYTRPGAGWLTRLLRALFRRR
jgi:hypothetical protein